MTQKTVLLLLLCLLIACQPTEPAAVQNPTSAPPTAEASTPTLAPTITPVPTEETLPPTIPAEPTPTLAPAATLAPPPADGSQLAAWLTSAWQASPLLADIQQQLLAAGWLYAAEEWHTADLTGDGRDEWLLTVNLCGTTTCPAEESVQEPAGDFWIINENGLVYRRDVPEMEADTWEPAGRLFDLADMTGDGLPEAVITTTTCGANTCYTNIQVISSHNGPLENIVQLPAELVLPEELSYLPTEISAPYVDLTLTDATGEGQPDLVLVGFLAGSVGAGIQREFTEVWGWDGATFTRLQRLASPSNYRFHLLYNANDAFAAEDWATAQALYEQVLNDSSLEEVGFTLEAEEVTYRAQQFAAFRLALLGLINNDFAQAEQWQSWLAQVDSTSPLAQATIQLLAEYQAREGLAGVCPAVTTFLQTLMPDQDDQYLLTDMGYNNPSLTVETVCPLP